MFWTHKDWKKYSGNSGRVVKLAFTKIVKEFESNINPIAFDLNRVRYLKVNFHQYDTESKFDQTILYEIPIKDESSNRTIKKSDHSKRCNRLHSKFQLLNFAVLVPKKNEVDHDLEIFHLDGTSTPIHNMNYLVDPKDSPDKRTPIVLETEKEDTQSYLDFFTTYVAGKYGPFLTVYAADQLCTCTSNGTQLFEDALRKAVINSVYKDEGAVEFGDPEKIESVIDKVSYLISLLSKIDSDQSISEWKAFVQYIIAQKENEEFSWATSLKGYKANPRPTIDWGKFFTLIDSNAQRDQLLSFFKLWFNQERIDKFQYSLAITLYGNFIYVSAYLVEKNGMIQMLDDMSIAKSALPLGQWQFKADQKKFSGFMALTFLPFRRNLVESGLMKASIPPPAINLSTYKKVKDDPSAIDWLDKNMTVAIENGYQEPNSKSDWVGQRFYRPIEMTSVSFFKELDFSNIKTDTNIKFRNCDFIGNISFENAEIGGNLIFENCTFYGIQTDSDPDQISFGGIDPALNLQGLRANGGLTVSRCKFFGPVFAKHIKVGQMGRFRGVSIMPLYDFYYKEIEENISQIKIDPRFSDSTSELDIRYSSFGGGLDLSASFDKKFEINIAEERKTVVTQIAGVLWSESCTVNGPLLISGLLVTSMGESFHNQRNRGLCAARFNGSIIEGDVLIWRPKEDPHSVYHGCRTYIESDLDFSNCDVRGNVDLRGIWVGRSLILDRIDCRGQIILNSVRHYDCYESNRFDRIILNEALNQPLLKFSKSALVKYQTKKKTYWGLAQFGRAHILKSLELKGSKIQGQLNLIGTFVGNKIVLDSCVIGGLVMESAIDSVYVGPAASLETIEKCDYLRYEKECGFKEYLDASAEATIFLHNRLTTKEKNRFNGLMIQRPECSGIEIRNSQINGPVSIDSLWIVPHQIDNNELTHAKTFDPSTYSEWLNSLKINVHSAHLQPPMDSADFRIENSELNGPLHLFKQHFFDKFWSNVQVDPLLNYTFNLAQTDGEIVDSKTKMANQLTKNQFLETNQKPIKKSRGTLILGEFIIANTTINGDVDLTGLAVFDKISIQNVNVNANITSHDIDNKNGISADINHQTVSKEMHIGLLNCQGNFKFYGSKVLNNFTTENTKVGGHLRLENARSATLVIRNTNINADLLLNGSSINGNAEILYSNVIGHCNFVGEHNSRTKISGTDINLSASSFGRLSMPVRLPQDISDQNSPGKWILNHAVTKHFDVYMAEVNNKSVPKNAPSEADFRGFRFDRLSLNGKDATWNTGGLERLLDLGNRKTEDFTLEAYAQTEQNLRNQGRRYEANKIYTLMQNRIRKKGIIKNWFEQGVHMLFFNLYTNFGSNWLTPFKVIVIHFLIGLSVAYSPSNWESTHSDHENKVKFSELHYLGVQKTINMAVPLIGFSPPLESKGIHFEFKDQEYTSFFPFEPLILRVPLQVITSLITIIGYIVWPVFLLTFSGLLRRK